MTVEEYVIYSEKARQMFSFLNGRVNSLNKCCILVTDSYDFVNRTYGNIRFPSNVIIHIGNIVDEWEQQYEKYMKKYDFVCTIIAWAITHELFHADQELSMLRYNNDEQYRISIEGDVERSSYDWVVSHAVEISQYCGFNVIIQMLTSNNLPSISNYAKAGVKDYYLQTIANIVIRDIDYFLALQVFTNDALCNDMILMFNDTESVVIKSNDKYLGENIGVFSSLVSKYCTNYNRYNIGIDVSFGTNGANRRMATVRLNISEGVILPIIM